MIARLRGKLLEKEPSGLVIEAGGVGYAVAVPLSTFTRLAGDEVDLFIHTEVRSDAILLFGFLSKGEREVFRQLLSVQGVGPMTALAVLSGLTLGELVEAVRSGDASRFRGIPRVGKKTAERICLELREKLNVGPPSEATPREPVESLPADLSDALLALVNLGYRTQEAREVLLGAQREAPEGPIEAWIRIALRALAH